MELLVEVIQYVSQEYCGSWRRQIWCRAGILWLGYGRLSLETCF